MNVLDELMETRRREMTKRLKTALMYDPDTYIVHLSHDDLDGYGCTVVSYNFQWYLNCMDDKNRLDEPLNSHYYYANTNRLGKSIYPVVSSIVQEMINGHFRKDNNKYTPTLYFLITDIGGIDVLELANLTRHVSGVNIHYIVVDHHRSMYQNMPVRTFGNEGYSVHHDADDNTIVFYRSKSSTKVDMYLTNGKESATKALYKLLYIEDAPFTGEMSRFTNVVSAYDTGDIGNWKVDSSHICYDETCNQIDFTDVVTYDMHVSEQVKLNRWWKCAYDEMHHVSTPTSYSYYGSIVPLNETHINKEFSMRKNFIIPLCNMFIHNRTSYCKYRMEIRWKIAALNRYYDMFVEKLQIIDKEDGADQVELEPGKFLKIPKEQSHVKRFAVFTYTRFLKDIGFEMNLTMFSKVYLPQNLDVDVLVMMNHIYDSIDTRAHKDEVNVYQICAANNGGGHPHAAGCPMMK